MSEDDSKEKKIIVDEDWKAQAQKEKEELATKEKEELAEKEKEEQDKEQQKAQRPPLPTADLAGLVSMLATQAFFSLGLITTEKDKTPEPDLELAKFNIGMFEVLREKTKGNITEDEENLFENTLHQLRMAFVQCSK